MNKDIFRIIEKQREHSLKNVFIVTGQLNSRENEPIDSIILFDYLQKNNIPSYFVMWKQHKLFKEYSGKYKNIIGLNGNGVDDYEFIITLQDIFKNVKSVIQENVALNKDIRIWLKGLKECHYVFLQHGYSFLKPDIGRLVPYVNNINVNSNIEADFIRRVSIEKNLNENFFINAGLPRLEMVKDESVDNTILFMFTWRSSFKTTEQFLNSFYLKRILNLFSQEDMVMFNNYNIKPVLSLHHHFLNIIRDLKINIPIKVIDSCEVSKYIRTSRMLITDYSSVAFDFFFQNKPVIFWQLDKWDNTLLPFDRNEIQITDRVEKAYFTSVETIKELMLKIVDYSKQSFKCEQKNGILFFERNNNICKELIDEINNL